MKQWNNSKLCILGITGSVGTQALLIAKKLGFQIVGCSYHKNEQLANSIIKTNKIKYVYCSFDKTKGNCDSFTNLLKKCKPQIVVNAIVGFAGLKATLAALKLKIDLAIANKESIVTAGWYIFPYAKKHNITILPIDSEHTNLYYQLLQAEKQSVNQVYITCSGGKYFGLSDKQKEKISYQQAINHKTWSMGQKITIDSNTLVNKCFEVVEAYWYFKTKRINVLHDPTSIIHSAVLLNDGEFIYMNSKPTMKLPIALAITKFKYNPPQNLKVEPKTDVLEKMNDVVPISWAYDIINDSTNSLCIIINSSNEVALKLFKEKKITFNDIIGFIQNAIRKIERKKIDSIEDIFSFDEEVRLRSIKCWK